MVDATLNAINSWYNDPTQGGDRPKLLSKLAAIELCGWLEDEFDRLVLIANSACLNDVAWVKKDVLDRNFGMTYADHLRSMLTKILGEVLVRRIEGDWTTKHPGELEQFKSLLGTLWGIRCRFAHSTMISNAAAQITFYAPNWFINQHRILKRLVGNLEHSMGVILQTI